MAMSKITAEFQSNIEEVWSVVTSLDNYTWRSDLGKIEVLKEGKQFVEYTKDGYQTTFTITAFQPFERYEFDMENENMTGHWTGKFSFKNGRTIIEFTEDVTVKKVFMRPFAKLYLKKQQERYIVDLRKALGMKDFEKHTDY